jgi:hypothetical protein
MASQGGLFCILKKSQLPHLEHHLFMAGPRAACAILKKPCLKSLLHGVHICRGAFGGQH